MSFLTNHKGTRIIIGVMVVLAVIGIAIAWVYYGKINKAVDPRVRQAQVMYGRYNVYASENNTDMVLAVLDSIKDVYASVDHYTESWEMGVVENNRASVFLTKALDGDVREDINQHYFSVAEHHLNLSLAIYNRWASLYGDLSEEEIKNLVETDFLSDPILAGNKNVHAIIRKRVQDFMTAQLEMPRRMSVCYTNLGIIRRHDNLLDEAIDCYVKALELWDHNHVAKNNLNILFGKPIEKQSILRKLFPPDRN